MKKSSSASPAGTRDVTVQIDSAGPSTSVLASKAARKNLRADVVSSSQTSSGSPTLKITGNKSKIKKFLLAEFDPELSDEEFDSWIVEAAARRVNRLDEGAWDEVRDGVRKLSSYLSKKFGDVAGRWASAIKEKLSAMDEMPDDVKVVFAALKSGMSETGESFKMDDAMQAAKEFGKLGREQALAIVQEDLEGTVKEKARSVSEGLYTRALYVTLTEHDLKSAVSTQRIDEALGVSAVLGVGLAVMGGLPIMFKGLHKLAKVMNAEKTAKMFERAYHVSHHFEEKVIDLAIPDKLSYYVYRVLWKKGLKVSKHFLELDAFKAGKEHAKQKTQGLIYKVVLLYFAWNGLVGVFHAGASLLGFVEGTATTVKGIELARGAAEVAALVKAGSQAV